MLCFAGYFYGFLNMEILECLRMLKNKEGDDRVSIISTQFPHLPQLFHSFGKALYF